MNWVGGSRSRFIRSSDVKKQKEFFEKKRRQKRLNHLAPPASPKGGSTGNIDLLTMFIVNQIALKKEHTGKPKISHPVNSKGIHKSLGQDPLELPMSPCAPSRLSLEQSEPQYSVHTVGLKKRKQSLLEEFKFKLSPLLETNQSDNSASDYKHKHHQDSVSSFSSASPTPSESFQTTAHVSSSSWEPCCTKTSQPIGLGEYDLWTQSTQISPALTGTQFGSPVQSIEMNGSTIHPVDKFPPNHLEENIQQEEPIFMGFNSEDNRDDDLFNKTISKIHLQKDSPQARAHDSHNIDHSTEISPQVYRCAECRPCSAHSSVSENACVIPVRSPRQESISLDTDDKQHMEAASSGMQICHCEDTLTIGSQYCSSEMNAIRRVLSFSQKTETSVGTCEKTSSRMREMGTQTAAVSYSTSKDASVQCCLIKSERRPNISTELIAPIHSNTKERKAPSFTIRRQRSKSNESLPNVTQCALSEIHKVKWNTPWKTSTTGEATQQVSEAITGQESSFKSENRAFKNNCPLPTLPHSHANAPESKEKSSGNMVVRGERCEGHKEESVNLNPAENAWSTEEHGRERGVNWVSGEVETLQEIADILLMLKQKNKH